MDDDSRHENGRHKHDQYKGIAQWIISPHQVKDQQAFKLMALIAEKDAAIQERNVALSEQKAALAERDMAILQRDAAIVERNNALMERDSAFAALEYARENAMNGSGSSCIPVGSLSRGSKHNHHSQHMYHTTHLSDAASYHSKEIHISEAYPVSINLENDIKSRRLKQPRKDTKVHVLVSGKEKREKKSRRGGNVDKQASIIRQLEWKCQEMESSEHSIKQNSVTKHERKGQDLGLNQVIFDESVMPPPVCSCTGSPQQCYKWGNGGWQSACCTMTLSIYPLPIMPNKKHTRIGGRKMSGSAFNKLLTRLAAGGQDLSVPLDLKEHWAKHGTNRYITIK